MNFGQNLYQWFLSNAQSLVLMSIVVIGIYLGFKREFSKLIGFLVVALIAVGLVFNAGGVKDVLLELYDKISEKYDYIYVLANSIGAYFTMHTLQNFKIEKALFISPILDMEQLIVDMMSWANVSEKELSERKEIPTDFGETLSWEYLCFVRENPINWKTPTEILYAEHDNLTSRQTVDKFIDRHCANLTVMNDGEHWFHTDEQILFRDNWLRKVIQ